MSSELEKMLQELLSDLKSFNPEKLREIVQEAVRTFTSLEAKSRSSDPEERADALKIATSLKEALQEQVEELSKMAGIAPRDFSSLTEGPDMDPEMLEEFKAAKAKLEVFQDRSGSPMKSQSTGHKKKVVWIPG